MNKKLFVLLVVLMSLSLIGIIFVQGYWIKSTVEDREEQFSYSAKQVLIKVSEQIQNKEFERYIFEYESQLKNTEQTIDKVTLTEYLIATRDELKNEEVFNFGSIQEADYKISSDFLGAEQKNDSIQMKKLINRKVTKIVKDVGKDTGAARTPSDIMERVMRLEDYEKEILRDVISEAAGRQPLRKRVSEKTIRNLLRRELASRDLDTKFEFAVYSNSIETGVHSDGFDVAHPATYGVPLFLDRAGNSSYQLLVNFKGKKGVVLSSVTLMAVLSIVFTLIIVIAYSSALSQLIRQRQISQIKTDFINNMTHEFKTPIATINLALDAIKNPKIIADETKVFRYLKMIRDENKRMHAQVENVLRISKLERNELDLRKERLQLHDIILDAITHVELIVEDRGGYIQTHFGALKSSILANEDHFTNVIVNILDNAIKYSEDNPRIDIYTENVKNYIIVKIRDQGAGMTRGVQKKIFEKFYREHTGDIHNVKGHGLGLAYVKQILDDHHGQISVNSEKGKGSTFIIKLPLIS
ncbi:sensor histidine kinase [Zunongwangia sp. HRR-M8]|uniref:sensor histidine kinase n=1 Tax=Zunongwangia sp. HRR-M8 TaxID=3015170 RepID=UPI0022DD4A03|nr:HAMP domain-containing sensor histidine kinase [Zunongwangia sp. HRR-M8]WBL23095.1 HAMP domain-containing sensor histidine kinase [Zunongwangia sp. HRR-M8]